VRIAVEVEVVQRDAPLEEQRQHDVVERLEEVERVPLLVRVDPHDLVAEILVLAADVRVRVVHVVVGVLPRLRRRRRVPVPRLEWICGSFIQSHWPCRTLWPISMFSRIFAADSAAIPAACAGGNPAAHSTARPKTAMRRCMAIMLVM
jgi:hypothetical protein